MSCFLSVPSLSLWRSSTHRARYTWWWLMRMCLLLMQTSVCSIYRNVSHVNAKKVSHVVCALQIKSISLQTPTNQLIQLCRNFYPRKQRQAYIHTHAHARARHTCIAYAHTMNAEELRVLKSNSFTYWKREERILSSTTEKMSWILLLGRHDLWLHAHIPLYNIYGFT